MEQIPEQTRKVDLQTIRGLWVILDELVKSGHGETPLKLADFDFGPCKMESLDLYDTSVEQEEGRMDSKLTFILS
jgi:hypothetical protein